MATPTLIAAYEVDSAARDTSTLVSPSFAPSDGEVLVIKASGESFTAPTIGLASGGGLTYTSQANVAQANRTVARLFTAVVTGSPGAMTVTVPFSGSIGWHSMVVERWENAQLAGTPAVGSGISNGAPSMTVNTTASGSVVSWLSADWQALAPGTSGYRSGAIQTGLHDKSPSFYVAYYAYQNTDAAGTQTFGLTSPTGQEGSLVGIELQGVSEKVQFERLAPNAGGAGSYGTSTTWSHTIAGENRLLLVGASLGSGPDTGKVLAASFNGVGLSSLALVHSNNQNSGYVQLFYLVNPPIGTFTVELSSNLPADLLGGSLSFIGVNQTTPVSGLQTAYGYSTTPSIAVTSKPGDMVVSTVANGSDILGSDQTTRWIQIWSSGTGASNVAQATAPGASLVNTTYTVIDDWWGIIGINLVTTGTSPPADPGAIIAWLRV